MSQDSYARSEIDRLGRVVNNLSHEVGELLILVRKMSSSIPDPPVVRTLTVPTSSLLTRTARSVEELARKCTESSEMIELHTEAGSLYCKDLHYGSAVKCYRLAALEMIIVSRHEEAIALLVDVINIQKHNDLMKWSVPSNILLWGLCLVMTCKMNDNLENTVWSRVIGFNTDGYKVYLGTRCLDFLKEIIDCLDDINTESDDFDSIVERHNSLQQLGVAETKLLMRIKDKFYED